MDLDCWPQARFEQYLAACIDHGDLNHLVMTLNTRGLCVDKQRISIEP